MKVRRGFEKGAFRFIDCNLKRYWICAVLMCNVLRKIGSWLVLNGLGCFLHGFFADLPTDWSMRRYYLNVHFSANSLFLAVTSSQFTGQDVNSF